MLHTHLSEAAGLILLAVQTHDASDVTLREAVLVKLRSAHAVTVIVDVLGKGSGECDELARDNPIEVTVGDRLAPAVIIVIECFHVEPADLFGVAETLADVTDGARVGALATGGVTIRNHLVVSHGVTSVLETLDNGIGGHAQIHGHVACHQTGAIGGDVADNCRGVVDDLLLGELVEKFADFHDVFPGASEVQGAEIFEESFVDEFAVAVEMVNITFSLARLVNGHPVKFSGDNFDHVAIAGKEAVLHELLTTVIEHFAIWCEFAFYFVQSG